MRNVILILATLSATLMADIVEYKGGGQQKSSCGEKQKYTAHFTFNGQDSLKVKVTVGEADKAITMEFALNAVNHNHDFFDVTLAKDPNVIVGHGYRFGDYYHYAIKVGNDIIEETLYFNNLKLLATGSKRSLVSQCEAGGTCDCATAWQGKYDYVQ